MPSYGQAKTDSATRQLQARTDGRTNGRTTHLEKNPLAPERTGEIERFIIRKRRFPRTGELAWSVEHSSLPAYFNHRLHLHSWQDALDYALAHAHVTEPTA